MPHEEIAAKIMLGTNGLHQGFPAWGTCTPRGTFFYLKGYI